MPTTNSVLPSRLQVRDSLGRPQTLGRGAEAFTLWPVAPDTTRLLVLGLGPYPLAEPHKTELKKGQDEGAKGLYVDDIGPQYTDICWLDCTDFHAALAQGHADLPPPPVPSHWRRIPPEQALAEAPQRDIRLYHQNLRLFPEFWGPLWAEISRQRLRLPLWPKAADTVILLHEPTALLARELDEAFSAAGFQAVHAPANTGASAGTSVSTDAGTAQAQNSINMPYWQRFLREQRPTLVLSINGQGLDAGGELFHLLRVCKVPVALWFVDNPWHILSRFRLPWWREAQLFCTDSAFIQPLRQAGAASVAHMPLAVAQHMWEAKPYASPHAADIPHGPLATVLFVGSLAFPARQAFFGAAKLPPQLLQEAFSLLENGARPDAQWWAGQLQPDAPLWPGHGARAVGLGAEECTLRARLLWLEAAAACGLSHYGHHADTAQSLHSAAGYSPELGQVLHHSRPPVDYYTALPRLYATAPYSLNVTSLLLPHGLTQRHFDVWAAGGFLLTDKTPGLDIFPPELTAEICVPQPRALAAKLNALEGQAHLRQDLQNAWQQHLREHHSYSQRVNTMCQQLHIV